MTTRDWKSYRAYQLHERTISFPSKTVAQVQSEKDNGLKSGEVAVNHQDSRFNNKLVKKSFNYGTGYGHYHHPDENLETSQYLTDLEQFYNYWFGG